MFKFNKVLPWAVVVLVAILFMRRFHSSYVTPQIYFPPGEKKIMLDDGSKWKLYAHASFDNAPEIKNINNVTRDDCAAQCKGTKDCIGFVRYGTRGGGPYDPGSCSLRKALLLQKNDDNGANTYFMA